MNTQETTVQYFYLLCVVALWWSLWVLYDQMKQSITVIVSTSTPKHRTKALIILIIQE